MKSQTTKSLTNELQEGDYYIGKTTGRIYQSKDGLYLLANALRLKKSNKEDYDKQQLEDEK